MPALVAGIQASWRGSGVYMKLHFCAAYAVYQLFLLRGPCKEFGNTDVKNRNAVKH